MHERRPIAGSVAKVLISKGYRLMISAQLELEMFPGQESATQFFAYPDSSAVEAVIFLPTSSQVAHTDIDSAIRFKAEELREFFGVARKA